MDAQQPPVGEGNAPQERPSSQYTPPPADYQPPHGRSGTDQQSTNDIFSKNLANDSIVKVIALGILLMFVGAMLIALVSTGGPNTFDDKYDENDDGIVDPENRDKYWEDVRLHDFLEDLGTVLGRFFRYLGVMILTIALFGGGIMNKNMDKFVRLSMILAAGFIIAWSAFI